MQGQSDADASEGAILAAFRRVAEQMPWYRTLLAEAAIDPAEVIDIASFMGRVPLLTKDNTFHRFPIGELAAATRIADLAGVLTTSGHGGRFAFGLTTRSHAVLEPEFIDEALDAAFAVSSRPTLVVNCLPMGVVFRSATATVATTSVREDMALGLVDTFGDHYEQIVIVADPLFIKRLIDYAASRHRDWRRVRTYIVLGEEIFGEHFRGYLAAALGMELDHPQRGHIISSFGVGELGLHLAYETPATVALRRAAWTDRELARQLFGCDGESRSLPAVLTFNPRRMFVEVVDSDSSGYGQLAISMLDPGLPIPLLRYTTGDLARVLDVNTVSAGCHSHNIRLPGALPERLIALRGRVNDQLPNGADVALYKDALYADSGAAAQLSGAFRVTGANDSLTLHIQRAAWTDADRWQDRDVSAQVLRALPAKLRPSELIVWAYDQFPFGMSLDYERKFTYLGEGIRPSP